MMKMEICGNMLRKLIRNLLFSSKFLFISINFYKFQLFGLRWLVVLFFAFSLLVYTCFAQNIKIDSLINNSKKYNGKIVEIEGEAIGHIMPRGGYAWLNINDGSNSFSIWMSREDASKVNKLGKNAIVGDIIRVNGIFNERCFEHGGEMDIHARNIEKLKEGYLKNIPIDNVKTNMLVFLVGALICLYFIKILKK